MLTTWIRIRNFRTVGTWIDVFGGTTDDESLFPPPLTLKVCSIGIILHIIGIIYTNIDRA